MTQVFKSANNITLNHIFEKIEPFTFPPIRKKIQTMPLQEPFTGVWSMEGNEMTGIILADRKKTYLNCFRFL